MLAILNATQRRFGQQYFVEYRHDTAIELLADIVAGKPDPPALESMMKRIDSLTEDAERVGISWIQVGITSMLIRSALNQDVDQIASAVEHMGGVLADDVVGKAGLRNVPSSKASQLLQDIFDTCKKVRSELEQAVGWEQHVNAFDSLALSPSELERLQRIQSAK